MRNRLFAGEELSRYLRGLAEGVDQKLQEWDRKSLDDLTEDEMVAKLIEKFSVVCPVLRRDDAVQEEAEEVDVTVSSVFGELVRQRAVRLVLAVPFDGERDVFHKRISSFGIGEGVELMGNELHIVKQGPIEDKAEVLAYWTGILDKIESLLARAGEQVDAHNAALAATVPEKVSGRRADLRTVKELQGELGYPIRQRARTRW